MDDMMRKSLTRRSQAIRLIAFSNLALASLGAYRLLLAYAHRSALEHVMDHQRWLTLIHALWIANAAVLFTLAVGSLLCLRETSGAEYLCSLSYLVEITLGLVLALSPTLNRLAGTEDRDSVMGLTLVRVVGNAGIKPQLTIFYPPVALSVLLVTCFFLPRTSEGKATKG
jgi:branched-subunit amino acid ABC-type transport system permease component